MQMDYAKHVVDCESGLQRNNWWQVEIEEWTDHIQIGLIVAPAER